MTEIDNIKRRNERHKQLQGSGSSSDSKQFLADVYELKDVTRNVTADIDSLLTTIESQKELLSEIHPHLGQGEKVIVELQNQIESQKEEIAKLNNRIVPDMSRITQNEYNQIKWISAEYGADYLINVVKHIAFLEGDKQMSEPMKLTDEQKLENEIIDKCAELGRYDDDDYTPPSFVDDLESEDLESFWDWVQTLLKASARNAIGMWEETNFDQKAITELKNEEIADLKAEMVSIGKVAAIGLKKNDPYDMKLSLQAIEMAVDHAQT